jgi:chemotaxis protein MotB
MVRNKKHVEHENHDRWLVSYADFITLLFAFFVVMFASSQTDKGKAQQVSESVKKAFEEDKMKAAIAAILGGTVDDKGQGNLQMKGPGGAVKFTKNQEIPPVTSPAITYAELVPSMRMLQQQLRPEIDSGMLELKMEARGLVISLRQAAFFPSGQDTIEAGTHGTIEKLAAIIHKLPNRMRFEGHTDGIPIHNARFSSNWELSSARSVAMMNLLRSKYDIPELRMSVSAYASTVPVASNETEPGRARNRRVDVVILSEIGGLAEPAQQPK